MARQAGNSGPSSGRPTSRGTVRHAPFSEARFRRATPDDPAAPIEIVPA